MLHDLSHPIETGMPVYPGDDPVTVRRTKWLDADGYNNHVSTHGQHIGTHVDGPMHMTAHPEPILSFALERFCGRALVFDVRGHACVMPDHVDLSGIRSGDIALFCTGLDAAFGSEDYFLRHPVLSEAMAERLLEIGVKLVGMDTPSPDRFPFPVHKRLLSAGVMLVENLRGLVPLIGRQDIRFYAFPLAVRADSSPVRAVAETDG